MAKKVVKKAGKAKVKKKWVPVFAPKSFNGVSLGETHVGDPNAAIGKTIRANLMHIAGDMRKQGIEIRFDIVKVADGRAETAVTGYELLPTSMKRIVRRGRSKVADSFVTRTATKRRIRIKPVVITTNPASLSAERSIRLAVRERLKEHLGSMSFDKIVQELINFKLQRVIKEAAQKTHPIKTAEVRACLLLPEGTSERRTIEADYRDEDFVEVKEASDAPKERPVKAEPVEQEDSDEQADPAEEPDEQAETPEPEK